MDITKILINYTDEVDREIELRMIEFGGCRADHLNHFHKFKKDNI